jgi:hypothetical protein
MNEIASYDDIMASLDADDEIDNDPEQQELTAALNALDREIADARG